MQITIQVSSKLGNSAQTTITTTTLDPAKEGSKALLRLVRLIENQEQMSSFGILLTAAGPKKIQTIKFVREQTGKGLKEAKDLVDRGGLLVSKLTAEQVHVWTQGLGELGASFEVVK